MKKNMGATDRIVRAILGLVFGILIFKGTLTGVLAWILGVFAVAFLVTAAIGFCPLYVVLKVNTCGKGGCGCGTC